MIGSERLSALRAMRRPSRRAALPVLAWGSAAVLGGAAVAMLVASGRWYLAMGLLLAVPAVLLILQHPLATIAMWFLVTPFVSVTDVASVRQVFWVAHRGLPLVALIAIVLGALAGVTPRRLPRLGWPEALMGGYVFVTVVSIAYSSIEPVATLYLLYERVVIPIALYLIVRLLQPNQEDLRRIAPVALFVLLSQALVGILSWVAPGTVPSMWLTHVGERTVGTFGDPDVFGTTALLCGWVLLHVGLSRAREPGDRIVPFLAFAFAMLMTFLTFSRGNWLAGAVVLIGVLVVYRRHARWLLAIVASVLALLLATGQLTEQLRFAERRLVSEEAEEAALSRLPVAVAAVRMFQEKPVAGWGYGNFDRYSRRYQTRVADLASAEKPHASHNLFLSILAEQGLLGFVLFTGPMLLWLRRSRSAARTMLTSERRLVAGLWLVIAAYVIVNNFSVMKVPFGLGAWWLTLGMIASIVTRSRTVPEPARERRSA